MRGGWLRRAVFPEGDFQAEENSQCAVCADNQPELGGGDRTESCGCGDPVDFVFGEVNVFVGVADSVEALCDER